MQGTLDDGTGTLARTTGLLRSFESVGSTFAYVTSATHWKYINTLILAFTLFVFQIPFTTVAAWLVPDKPYQNDSDDAVHEDIPRFGEKDESSNSSVIHGLQKPIQLAREITQEANSEP